MSYDKWNVNVADHVRRWKAHASTLYACRFLRESHRLRDLLEKIVKPRVSQSRIFQSKNQL